MTPEFFPEARRDLYDCTTWYENRSRGLGDQFLEEVEVALRRICETPRLFGRTEREIPGFETRIIPVRRFRHFVTYLLIDSRIFVLAIDRGRRRNTDWIGRLTDYINEQGDEE